MNLTLYRKYRPQSFKEVIGQNHIKTTIQSELETDKIAHAYLFSGPRGLGKTTMARLLAKAVNCLKRKENESEPCNTCAACTELMDSKSLDVIEIDAASHTGVDNVRENIINNSRFTPTSRKFKVFIIDEVHMLSTSAFNALLKTLEEPPAHAMFILATTEIHKVPQTIISRCQHFQFHKVTQAEIVQRLTMISGKEKKKVDKSILENIAYYADGGIRDAESLLGQILVLGDKEITAEQAQLVLPQSRFDLVIELIEYLNKSDSTQAISLINRLVQEGVDLERFSADVVEVLRKTLLIKVSSQLQEFTGTLDKDLEKRISAVSDQVSLEFLIRATEIFIAKRQELKFADIPQLPLELAILEIINEPDQDPPNKPSNPGNSNEIAENKVTKQAPTTTKPAPVVKSTTAPKKTLGKVKLSLEQVKDKWEEVLICLKKYNQSLSSALRIGQVSIVREDGTLEVCFKHKFHQQRVNDLKNKQILEKVLEEIFGVRLIVKTIVVKEFADDKVEIEAITQTKSDDSVDSALKAFGGQLVD